MGRKLLIESHEQNLLQQADVTSHFSQLVEQLSPPYILSHRDQYAPILTFQGCHTYHDSVMAPAEPNVDYYAVLEISNIATIELVTKSYRRLAKLRHPDKNPSADSTAVFQLVKQPPIYFLYEFAIYGKPAGTD